MTKKRISTDYRRVRERAVWCEALTRTFGTGLGVLHEQQKAGRAFGTNAA